MSEIYSAAISLSQNGAGLGDGDESNFFALGNLSMTISIAVDSSGYVIGSGTLAGQYSGYAIGEQDNDDDGFSDYANNTPFSVNGSGGGVTFSTTFGNGGFFSFQGTLPTSGTTISGTATLTDYTNGTTLSGPMTLSVSNPPAVASLLDMANFANDVYDATPNGVPGWTASAPIQTALGQIVNYSNADGSQVVIAVEGTVLSNVTGDDWTDLTAFPSGNPTSGLTAYVAALVSDIQQVLAANPHAAISLTGHSLGGAVAQMVGEYTGFATTTFNAPGAQDLYASTAIQNALAPLKNDVSATTGPNINYRTQGDLVSLVGAPIGNTQTIVPASGASDTVWNVLTNHSIETTISNLQNPATTLADGSVEPNSNIQGLANALFATGHAIITPISATVEAVTAPVTATPDFLGNDYSAWIDPVAGAVHVFTVNPGAPLIKSVTFVADPNFATYEVWGQTASGWSAPQFVQPGESAAFLSGTTGIMYEGVSATGQPVAGADPNLFYAVFAGAGTVSGTLSAEAACFARGTRLLTERGAVAIEALRIGDLLPTADGDAMLPVIWIGHRRVDCRCHPAPRRVWPVRVRAHAFGHGLPARDLRLSPDHAVRCGDFLIPVRCLVNGATVVQEAVADITYFHVELPRHALILAEGLPAESYLDLGNRGAFANGGGAIALHPDFAARLWQDRGCAELVMGGTELAAARARLLVQAALLGHDVTEDAGLRIAAAGRNLRPDRRGDVARILLPSGLARIRLRSAICIPGTAHPAAEETAPFGIAVTALLLDRQAVPLDDPRLGEGWHDEADGRRWTDGDAVLSVGGAREVLLRVAPGARYWAGAAPRATSAAGSGRASR